MKTVGDRVESENGRRTAFEEQKEIKALLRRRLIQEDAICGF